MEIVASIDRVTHQLFSSLVEAKLNALGAADERVQLLRTIPGVAQGWPKRSSPGL